MEERFDAFDEAGNLIGIVTRQEAHRLGVWHRTFHCWVLHRSVDGDFLVLQRRHRSKDTYPNKLDISCAGHLEAGEEPSDGVRELEEELGLTVPFEELLEVGKYRNSDVNDAFIDNEFFHIYLLVSGNASLADYRPAAMELSGLYLIGVQDMMELCRRERDEAVVHGYEMDDDGGKKERSLGIGRKDMKLFDISYYELLFARLQSVLE
ncbi:NUDIX domain-containing protein [Paenibacillus sp. HB172176]|uniref:NUDIX hydrolase n=1 Tax=Paenibacillus sp. HB172176 TaxID=2493690 RepID=UPI00143C836D|nr:NUDIX domain-containing protein [Paenibacillus sp. HB172176]